MFKQKINMQEFVDIHAHILPMIDDGAQNMEETLEMLRCATEDGIKSIIVTPHYKNGRRNASINTIYKRIEQVSYEAEKNGIEISLYPGHEIFYFSGLAEALEEGEVLTLNDTNCVLIEFMPGEQFASIRNGIDSICGCGYTPIVAHVERYECLLKDWKLVRELKQMDCEIQVNASSINGALGHTTKKFVHKLLKERLVDYVGTDAHDAKKRTPSIKKSKLLLYKKYDHEYVDAILYKNAMGLIEIEEG